MKRSFFNLFFIEKEKYLPLDIVYIGTQILVIINITEDSMFNPSFYNFVKYGENANYAFVWFNDYDKMELLLDDFVTNTKENFIVYIDEKNK